MFQFAGCPPRTLWIHVRVRKVRLTWVPPFRYLRIDGYLPLPAAFRSLSRLSSACSAKASALCPPLLNHLCTPSVACRSFFWLSSLRFPPPRGRSASAVPLHRFRPCPAFLFLLFSLGLMSLVLGFLCFRYSVFKVRPALHFSATQMGLSGLEPPTSRLSGVRSNRLSYKPRLLDRRWNISPTAGRSACIQVCICLCHPSLFQVVLL